MLDVARFCEAVRQLAGWHSDADHRLAIAVSGGADSLALMRLAAAGFGSRAHVLTVDHGLRPEAAAECDRVVQLAAECGLQADVLRLQMQADRNVQAMARAQRYAAMAERCRALGVEYLLTAHHQDDQAETLLMRLARGSGLRGLASIRPRSQISGIAVLRPLLGHGRAELRALVDAAGWVPVDDPSNHDPRHDRTRVRQWLASAPMLSARQLAASARHLQQAEAALQWAEDRAWASRVQQVAGGGLRLNCEALPEELRWRLLRRALQQSDGHAPEGGAVYRLLRALDAGQAATLGHQHIRPMADGSWLMDKAPPRRNMAKIS